MRTTIDRAGRLVIPQSLRDQVGLRPGEVDVVVDGTALRIEPPVGEPLEARDGRLLIPAAGTRLTDDDIRALRDADRGR